ncbi:MAG: GNAT family N-acetyltransferase [Rubrobacter sp.]
MDERVKPLRLLVLSGRFVVCWMDRRSSISVPVDAGVFSVTRTPDELSIVCDERYAPEGAEVESGWCAIKVEGSLEFSQTGVISSLTVPLAEAEIPVFVVSTFETDYLFVKEEHLGRVTSILPEAGHTFVEAPVLRPLMFGDEDFMREMLTAAAHAENEEAVAYDPELSRYIDGWGQDGDLGFVAEDASGEPLGAAWVRLFPAEDPGYGFVGEDVPELAVGVRAGERGEGIGRALIELVISESVGRYPAISLSVRQDNQPALRLYRRLGFKAVEGREVTNRAGGESFMMRLELR